MARGTISGILAGVVVAGLGIGAAAIWMEPVRLGDEPAVVTFGEEAEAPDAPEPEAAAPEGEAVAEADPEEAPAPESEMPEAGAEDVAEAPEAEMPEAEMPVAEMPEAEMNDAEPLAEAPETSAAEVTAEAAPDVEEMPEAEVAAEVAAEADANEKVAMVAPEPVPEAEPAPEPSAADEPEAVADPAPEAEPEAAPEEEPAVVTGRLPSIGAEPEAEEAAPIPAIVRNALPYEGDPALPEMSVLLIDTGGARSEVGDLAVLPFPLSVAVDASAPDAEEAIRYYRDNNAEVVVIVPLPEGATATDVDVTFQAYGPLLEDAVAVMVPEDVKFQALGGAAVQVAVNLAERGLGLVTYPEGLNTGHKSAVKEEVPAGLVFRDLDGEGQAPDVVRRFLDNVAFKARNEDAVIALARVKPDSLQAILEWSLGNRAQTVNMAPVSAVLQD